MGGARVIGEKGGGCVEIRETEVEGRLRRRCEESGGMCVKFIPDYLKGFPDRIVLLPNARVVFVETKKPVGGKVSTAQKFRLGKLRRLGFDARVIWTCEQVDAFAREFGLLQDSDGE